MEHYTMTTDFLHYVQYQLSLLYLSIHWGTEFFGKVIKKVTKIYEKHRLCKSSGNDLFQSQQLSWGVFTVLPSPFSSYNVV